MKFIGLKNTEKEVVLRYETTYKMSWSRVLDFMQIFFNDISSNLKDAAYLFIAGSEPVHVSTIKEGLLYKTEEFKEEKGAIILSGNSKTYNALFSICAYNQLKIVDVKIPLSETQIINEIYEDNHLLDVYMNSLEINACVRDAQRYAINLFGLFLDNEIEDKELKEKEFKEMCVKLNAEPFPKQKNINCPICGHIFKYDDSKIPNGEKYEIVCPKCNGLLKRKK